MSEIVAADGGPITDETSAFETLLSEMSEHFGSVDPDSIDREIDRWLAAVGDWVGVDRGSVIQGSAEGEFRITSRWAAEGLQPVEGLRGLERFPWLEAESVAGRIVAFRSVRELPAAARTDLASFEAIGARSSVMIPLHVGNRSVGLLSLCALTHDRDWPASLVNRLRLLGQVFANAIDRKLNEQALEGRVRFETLLSDMSAAFVGVELERVDPEIQKWLGRVVEFLDAERGSVVQALTEDDFRVTHSWAADGIDPVPTVLGVAEFPWIAAQMERGEIVAFGDPSELPEEALIDRESYARLETRSHVVVPLRVGDQTVGAIGIASVTRSRSWPDDVLQRLRIVGEVFANALARLHVARKLRLTEERYTLASSSGKVGVWDWDLETDEIYVDPALKQMLGYWDHEIPNRIDDWAAHVHPDDVELVMDAVQRHLSGELPVYEVEHRMVHRDGGVRWFLARGNAMRDADGKPYRIVGTDTCITDRKIAERTLRERETRLSNLAESTKAVPWEADAATWRFTYIGPRAVDMLGYPVERWSEPGFWEAHIIEADRKEAIDFCAAASRKCTDYEFEYRMRAADGRTIWIEDIVTVDMCDGRPRTLSGFMIDVTERKQMEQALADSEKLLTLITDSLPAFIAYVDTEGRYVFNNATYGKWLEVAPEQLMGKHISEVMAEEPWERTRPYLERALEGEEVRFEGPLIFPKRGERHLDCSMVPDRRADGSVAGLIMLASDVTERVGYEQRLLEAKRFAEVAGERLRDLSGRLIDAQEKERGRVARELHDGWNQRLAVLAIELGTLRANPPDQPDETRLRLKAVQEGLMELSADVRSISHELHPASLEHLGLGPALKSFCTDFAEQQGIRVSLELDGLPSRPRPDVALCLYRVAQECLRNVAKHSGAREATVKTSLENGMLELRVHDEGGGFDPESARNRRGLGLVSMRERVQIVHGSLDVVSSPGKGTEIVAAVPLNASS